MDYSPAPAAVADEFESFSVTMEFQSLGLPVKGQLAALLRFSTPDISQVLYYTRRGIQAC
jgi:hypothetical protein